MIGLLVVLHLIAAAAVLMVGRSLGRWIFAVAIAPLAICFVAIATEVSHIVDGATLVNRTSWVSALSLEFSFRLDGFAAVMALLVTGIGVVVLLYASGYFAGDPSPGTGRPGSPGTSRSSPAPCSDSSSPTTSGRSSCSGS